MDWLTVFDFSIWKNMLLGIPTQGTGVTHPLDNGQGDDRVEPCTFLRKPDLTQQAYAGIGKGMSPSYVWVARKPVNAAVFNRHTADRNLMGRTLTDTVITALLSFFLWRCPILLLMAITPVYHPASVNIPLLFPLYYPQKFHINSIWNFYATQNLPNNHYLVCFEN